MIKMNRLISNILLVFFTLLSFVVKAQLSDKEKLVEVFYLIDEKRYSVAQPLLEELHEKSPDNPNINYNLGLVYLKSFHEKEKEKALPLLELASKHTSPNYIHYSHREKRAPVDAWYYLGLAQHNDYQFLEAIESFNTFRTYVNEKHYLWKEIDKQILMANYAMIAIQNPVKIKTTNLGNSMNGFYPDFSPVVRIDESAIYFTSRRMREDSSNANIFDPVDGMLYEDIYVSFNEDGQWSEAVPLNINGEGHEATVNISVDGRTLYVYKDINGNGELYTSELIADSAGYETWSDPKKLGSDINSKAYETHVTVTPDEKTLYFVSDREGGFGGKDIYFCKRLPTGQWALSQNAGPIVNSEFDEDGVFIHPDGKTMYFSSNGHESMGGYDINYTILTDSGWTRPENIGYPINSVDDDVFFVTTPDGKRAYFSSFKEEGYGEKDIYMLELIEAEEIALTLYRGEFTFVDRRTPPSGAQVSITDNESGELIGVYNPRQRDGQFSAILTPNKSYHFVYEADAYEAYEEDIYVPSNNTYSEIYKDIQLKPVRVGNGLSKITPAPIATANLKGGIVKLGKPLNGLEIQLLNEGEGLINKTTSDSLGDFQFADLDPYKTYLIRVISKSGNPLHNYDVNVVNDRGETLTFEELDDTTYIFVPSSNPYEFYGISAREIAGVVKKDGKPVQGLNVRLENANKDLIQQEETDMYGKFNFQKLSLDDTYRIVFEGDVPDDPEIYITNELGERLVFKKVGEGIYEYVPIGEAKGSSIAGTVTNSGTSVNGLKVRLEDGNQSMLQSTTTDATGQFNFLKLDLDKSFRIVFEGDFPDQSEIVLYNEFGQELNFVQVAKGVYEYTPTIKSSQIAGVVTRNGVPVSGLNVRLENEQQGMLQKETTDEVGEFNFQRLDLDKTYRIVFEGDFPDDAEIVLVNEFGQELSFVKVGNGVYEYVPQTGTSRIAGVVSKNGTPLSGLNVRLEDERQTMLQKETTDEIGEFNFQKLHLDRTYRIVFEGDFPDDAEIVVMNERGEQLNFVRVAEGVYEYRPDGQATPQAKYSNIAGTVSSVNGPIQNLKVLLFDDSMDLLNFANTDDLGKFDFMKLNLAQPYTIKFEGDFPQDVKLIVANDDYDLLLFRKIEEGVYRYDPVFVRLEADGENLIKKEITDNVDAFNYAKLEFDKSYRIVFEGNFPLDDEILIVNEKGEEFTFIKVEEGVYVYTPKKTEYLLTDNNKKPIANANIRLEDGNRKLIDRLKTNDLGYFEYKKLPLDKEFHFILEDVDVETDQILISSDIQEQLVLLETTKGDYLYVPQNKYGFKSYTIGVQGNPDFKETYPRPEELVGVITYYQKYFPYNAKDINESNEEFKAFIADIAKLVKQRGFTDIIITSSASKVPTRTWKTNAILTKKRAYDTKALLEKVFSQKGLKSDQYNFVDINTLITGPEYKGDYIKNRPTYEKHQYVRIFVK